ncbi:hypothetical protein HMPREF1405_01307 [Helicobacter pylori GAM231Ai]|nr:hypothetical protein HMPREF1405_01307 [Helicobacter pylori GAM231Ai]
MSFINFNVLYIFKKWVFKTLVLSFWLSFYNKTHFIEFCFIFLRI